ncbi:EthD family reductase [Maribacter huludaoensis]|uniref:EthD family reductase n=1 Tax=Maribacter huludaoensis TaxID=3030010 RepID=UPI0030B7FD90
MIKVSVMYPNSEGVKFDTEYYKNTHLPMVQKLVGSALKELELDLGVGGRAPGKAAPYVAIAHLSLTMWLLFKQPLVRMRQHLQRMSRTIVMCKVKFKLVI